MKLNGRLQKAEKEAEKRVGSKRDEEERPIFVAWFQMFLDEIDKATDGPPLSVMGRENGIDTRWAINVPYWATFTLFANRDIIPDDPLGDYFYSKTEAAEHYSRGVALAHQVADQVRQEAANEL